jgi:hypothetical protein
MATLLSGAVRNPTSPSGFITLGQTQAALGNTPSTATGFTVITVNSQTTYASSLGRIEFTFTNTANFIQSNIPNGDVFYRPNGTGTLYLFGDVVIPSLDAQTAFKGPVQAATTASIDLIGGAPIEADGYALSLNDRVLVRAQATTSQNGIYVVSFLGSGSNGTWSRSADTNTSEEVAAAIVNVINGDTLSGRYFYNDFKATDILGTDPVNWYQLIADSKPQDITNKLIDATDIGTRIPGKGVFTEIESTGSFVANKLRLTSTETSTTTDSGALVVAGGVGIGDNMNIGGPVRIYDLTSATSTFSGALIVQGGAGFNGDIYAQRYFAEGEPLDNLFWNGGEISAPLRIRNPAQATNTYSGALQVWGGAGIGGDLYVGKSITLETPVETESVYFRMRNTATNGQSYTWRVGGNNFAGQAGANLNEGGITLLNDTQNILRLAITKTTGNLLVGPQTDNGVDKLQVSGSVRFGDGQLFTRSTSINNTSTTVIDSFPAANYRTAKLLVQIADGVGTNAKFHVVEIVVLVDNNGNVYKSEYGIITTGGAVGEFDVDYNIGGNGLVRLLFTADEISAKQVKVVRTSISR